MFVPTILFKFMSLAFHVPTPAVYLMDPFACVSVFGVCVSKLLRNVCTIDLKVIAYITKHIQRHTLEYTTSHATNKKTHIIFDISKGADCDGEQNRVWR